MSVAVRTITRLQDADDINVSLGAGVDEYALCWDNDTAKFVLRAMSGGGVTDHGALTGLADDDHTQYLLATGARTGASSQAQTFTNGIIGPTWKPASNSTTALKVQNAAGTSDIITVDTTNKRVGIGTNPSTFALDVFNPSTAAAFAAGSNGTSIFSLYSAGTDTPSLQFGIAGVGSTPYGTLQAADVGAYRAIALNPTYGNVGIGLTDPDSVLHVSTPFFDGGAVGQLLTLSARYGSAASAGFGSRVLWELKSSTTADQAAAAIQVLWNDATHATRKADLVLTAYDTSEREGLRIRGDGSGPAVGFYGVAPIARAVLATGAGATVDNVITALQNLGLVKQS